jgi:uncharacterized repeat protein (TIGR01451 family)
MRTWILPFLAFAATAQIYPTSAFAGGGALAAVDSAWKKAGADEGLRQAFARAAYTLEDSGHGTWRGVNPVQRLTLEFNGQEARLNHPDGSVSFQLTGYGYGDRLRKPARAVLAGHGNRLEYQRGDLTEWYVNGSQGLEQGFTLARRPGAERENGPLAIALDAAGGLAPAQKAGENSVRFESSKGVVLRYAGLRAVDAGGRVLPSRLQVRGREIRLLVEDQDAQYPLVVDPTWTQQQQLTASDATALDQFGTAVSISGNTAVVGANAKNSGQGAAYVFVRSGGVWTQQQELTASDGAANDGFGGSVLVSGDTAVIGAFGKNSNQGAAYVFVRSGGVWSQQQKLTASDGAVGDYFGLSVSVSGDTAVIGAYGKNGNQGATYVFVRSGGVWSQQQKLTASDSAAQNDFGVSVSVTGDTAVIGANGNNSSQGAAYVFVRSGGVWSQQQKLTASDGLTGDYFGYSVSVSGDTAVIGARGKNSGQGAAYVFVRSGVVWSQQQKLTASDGAANDIFGQRVAVSGDTAVIGAYGKNGGVGAAYVFVRSGVVWSQQQELNPSAPNVGADVSVSGDTMVIGAVGSASVFVDPMLGTNSLLVGSAAGASSVVLTDGGAWTATSNSSFLHISTGSASGTGSGVVVFTYDAFTGTGTRTGTLTIAGLPVTVTQAGTNYVGPGPVLTLVSSGLNGPSGVAVDGSGNVYVADRNNNAVKEWSATTQQVTTLVSSGLSSPGSVAVDGSGNVYIADSLDSAIKEWSAATQQVTTLVSSGLNQPWGAAVDGSGNVYIADSLNSAIKEWSAATQQVTSLVSSGLSYPNGVAVDGSGNVYIADYGSNSIMEQSAATQQLTTLATTQVPVGQHDTQEVAVDGSGNVYIADFINNAINEIPYVFVGPASLTEPASAGSDSLLQVLPATTNLTGIFAPTSDQSWLTIGSIANGVVSFSFTANTSASRTAHIALLGQQITVTQSGGGVPALTAVKTHTGNFAQGQINATYTITVSNTGTAPTNTTVTATETVPTGLTLVSMQGTGWTCPGTAANNCTRSDALNAGASYQAITATVNVAANASSPQVNSAAASGGGSAQANCTDSTTIAVAAPAAMSSPSSHATLGGSVVTFQWTAGTGPTEYWLAVSKVAVGGQELFYSDEGTNLTQVVSGLPTDGSTIYVRLSSKINGSWQYVDYTYTAPVTAVMTSPANHATLSGPVVTFQWTSCPGATDYWLAVSKVGVAGEEIYYAEEGTSLSQVVSGLPTDGSTIYVRLWSKVNGVWPFVDYTYTGGTATPVPAAMTSPANHATLAGASVTFQWNAGTAVTQYRLYVSKIAVGGSELYGAVEGTSLSQLVTGLPTDGSTVYVRLGSMINSAWQSADYTYTAATITPVPAAMTSPANHATLAGASVTFQWNAGTAVTQYSLAVSKVAVGGSEIYGAVEGTSLSQLVTGLPTDGSTVYVRLGSQISAAWQYADYTYTAANTTTALAAMTSPANHATLTGSAVNFQWSTGTGATEYWLAVSKVAVAGTEIFYSDEGTNLSQVVTGLPTDGSTIYVRLWSKINGAWPFVDYTYTAASPTLVPATMTSPANNAILTGSSVTFQWNTGTGVTQYRLYVSKVAAGGSEIYGAVEGTSLSQLVTGLPTDGSTVYVRLGSMINSAWQSVDYTYTAANTGTALAAMTSPANHATLTGSSVNFQWSTGTGATEYWLAVSKVAVAGTEIFYSDEGTNLSQLVTGLPTDGSTIYVRLWSKINGVWPFVDYTYTAASPTLVPAAMTSPANHATLTASSVTFQWNAGTGVTQYSLSVSKVTVGGSELYGAVEGTNLSQLVTGLPTDGSTIYVRLGSMINSSWQYADYTYTAANTGTALAAMTSPANHATLTGSSVTFQWSTGTGATEYWLAVSKVAVAGTEIFYSDEGTNLSQLVTGLPTDGSTVYVRLWSKINGAWPFVDYTYTATSSTLVPAAMTSPANHATLTGSSVTFQWNAGTGVALYSLYVSKVAVGGSEIYGAVEGTSLSQMVTGLPTDGSTVYVRLGSMINSSWQYADYTYTAANTTTALAAMTSPANHATLTGSSVTFQWSTGSGATEYWLAVSKVGVGGQEIFYSDEGTNLSQAVTGLPIDGSTVYVRLWSKINGAWPFVDYTYTAANTGTALAAMTNPANYATLTGSSVTFQWSTGSGATEYWLAVSKVGVGGQEIFYSDEGTNLSQLVTGLPIDGSTVYVRLWSKINGAWPFVDYTYTAANSTPVAATMTSPANYATLTGSSVTFQWNAGTGVTQYRLYVSKVAVGGSEIYGAAEGTSLSQLVTGLPTDGSTVYVRLGSMINSAWQSADYTYTAATIAPTTAAMTSPASHATLTGSTVTFQWSTGTGVADYWLAVSKVGVGGHEIYYSDEGTNLLQVVNGLPIDGSTVYVRLWSEINGAWPYVDYTYTAANVTAAPATMSSPANNATLAGSSVNFQWTTGTGVTEYWLSVSNVAVGGREIYYSDEATNLSQVVSGLPTNGSTVYVRLWSKINGAWSYIDYAYTASH